MKRVNRSKQGTSGNKRSLPEYQPPKSSASRKLPFVFLNVAMSADGKIAPPNRAFTPFTSETDQKLLFELRSRADAIMAGARTVETTGTLLGPGAEKYRALRLRNGLSDYNLRIIVSGTGSVRPNIPIFHSQFSPIIILTTERISRSRLRDLQRVATELKTFGDTNIDFRAALAWLRSQWNVGSLLCEGGGELNAALLEAGLVHEINLTISPKIFTGRDAPTIADGPGIPNLSDTIQLELTSSRRVSDEIFLTYRVLPPPSGVGADVRRL